MIQVKELLPLTGYVRGGCSPIGMKKSFVTVMDITALDFPYVLFSGGKIGLQIKMDPNELSKLIRIEFKDIKE
jgi:Cys-tRNA(Pro)/Cys-tRNA(Cys) deacylase